MRQGATGPGYLDRIWHVSSPLSRRPMIPCAGQALGCPVKGVHQRTLHAGESRRGFIRLHIHSKLTMTTSSGRCSNATHVTSQDGFRDANKFVARVFRGTAELSAFTLGRVMSTTDFPLGSVYGYRSRLWSHAYLTAALAYCISHWIDTHLNFISC